MNKLTSTEKQYSLFLKSLKLINPNKIYFLLDVGGGEGIIRKFLPKNIIYHSIDFGKKHTYNFDLDKGKFPIKDNFYDIIICTETLEHVMYPDNVIKEILRVSKKEASLFFSMPNEYNFVQRIYYLFGKKTQFDEPFKVVEKHLHIHKPRVKDILNLFSSHFKIIAVDYAWQSRSSLNSGFARSLDNFINVLAKINPNLFTRTVSVQGVKK